MAHLRCQIESVQSSSASFLKVHEELLAMYADEIDEEQKFEALDAHEDHVAETLSLITRLIDLKNVHMRITDFDRLLAAVETKIAHN